MKWKPRSYQLRAIQHVLRNRGSALFLDPGLGKTSIVLACVRLLRIKGELRKPALIVAPRRVIDTTWPDEMTKWDQFKDLSCVKVVGSDAQKNRALWDIETPIKLVTPDTVRWMASSIRKHRSLPFDSIWIDESTKFKSPGSRRFRSLRHLFKKVPRRCILSGTPTPNGLLDLWSQMFMVDLGEALDTSFERYKRRFFKVDQWNRWQVHIKEGAEEEIHRLIAPLCLRMSSDDWLKLPPLLHPDPIKVLLDDRSYKLYRQMEKQMFVELDEDKVTAASAAAKSMKLHQITNGHVYDEDGQSTRLHEVKIVALTALLEEIGDRQTIIAYTFKSDLEMLRGEFEGEVLADDTKKISKTWNSGKTRRLFAHPRSVAHGLNLQGAGGEIHIVWYGLTWSLEDFIQLNKRAHRQGVENRVVVHRIMAENTIDEAIAERLVAKDRIQENLLQYLKRYRWLQRRAKA